MELNKICRICLSEKCNMKDIFNVVDIIKNVAPIQLEKEDGLPSTICPDCLLQANQAYSFRQLCIQSDVALRQQGLIIKEEPKDVSTYSNYLEKNIENNFQISDQVKMESTNETKRINTNMKNTKRNIKIGTKLCCRFCNEKFDNTNDYREHRQNHRKELNCHICEKTLASYLQFRKHIYMHKQKGSFLCNTCGKVFTHKCNLKMHLKVHAGIKSHKCSVCNKSFVHSSNLKSHMLSHTKEKPHLCNNCGARFSKACNLQCHIERRHLTSPDKKPYLCYCGKSFRVQAALNEHQKRVHTTERKYICQVCNKGYKSNSTLRQHEKIHKRA